MFWVVQNNLYNEYGYTALMNHIVRMGIPHQVVKPVPGTGRFVHADFDSHAWKGEIDDVPEPFIDDSGLVMVCGAYTLSFIAQQRGWVPGTFTNENFNFESCLKAWGEEMLNHDSHVVRFDEVPKIDDYFFIRPCYDSKAFPGEVYDWEEFEGFRKRSISIANDMSLLQASTPVMYCGLKDIRCEYRFFVIDGQIITGSLYKRGNRVIHSDVIDPDVLAYARDMVALWQPARGFVIDIALLDNGVKKVIEINNLNSAGFYACDVAKIVDAVENMSF